MFIPTEFVTLSHDRTGSPLVILREVHGSRELRLAISGNDASRIAILSFGMLKDIAKDLSQQLITALHSEISQLRIVPQENNVIRCDLFLSQNEQMVQVSPRPGEAIILAIQNKCPISVAEELFYPDKKEPSLKDKIRGTEVLDFGTYRLF